jgi:hypothetical protein
VKFSIFPTSFQTRHSPKFIPPLAFRLWLFPASPARHGRLEKSRSIRPGSTPRGSSAQMSDYHTSPDNARPTEIISFEFSFRPESGKGRPHTVDMPPIEGDDFGRGHVRFPRPGIFPSERFRSATRPIRPKVSSKPGSPPAFKKTGNDKTLQAVSPGAAWPPLATAAQLPSFCRRVISALGRVARFLLN